MGLHGYQLGQPDAAMFSRRPSSNRLIYIVHCCFATRFWPHSVGCGRILDPIGCFPIEAVHRLNIGALLPWFGALRSRPTWKMEANQKVRFSIAAFGRQLSLKIPSSTTDFKDGLEVSRPIAADIATWISLIAALLVGSWFYCCLAIPSFSNQEESQ